MKMIHWNLGLGKCFSLYRGFVSSKTWIKRILGGKQPKCSLYRRYRWELIFNAHYFRFWTYCLITELHIAPARLRAFPHFPSRIVERAKRARAFLPPRRVSPFSRGVIFTRARVSLTPLSLRENKGLLDVRHSWFRIRDSGIVAQLIILEPVLGFSSIITARASDSFYKC